jgi:hypothetical protein
MGQVTQHGEQHVLINVIPFGKKIGKRKISNENTKIQQRIARENTTTH